MEETQLHNYITKGSKEKTEEDERLRNEEEAIQ